jgi:uncharacterized protein (DUF486 family)
LRTIILLVLSNIFMTFAWYGHLKFANNKPLLVAILASWGIAFFEYCLQVPANRLGYSMFTLAQLKVLQEAITLIVFAIFAVLVMGESFKWNHLMAALCLVGAVYFVFK